MHRLPLALETSRPHAPASRVVVFALAAALAACGDATGPSRAAPPPPRNTVAVRVTGALAAVDTLPSLGGFQPVRGTSGSGVHLQAASIDGLPLALHIPGRPVKGSYPLGRWDPSVDYVRHAVTNVVRKPSLSFGDRAVVALGYYASVGGGRLEIDSVALPNARTIDGRGIIRGRLRTRAVPDARLVPPGVHPTPDTIEIEAAFHSELENWPDGRATATVLSGSLDGIRAPQLVGSGSVYYHGCPTEAPPLLVVGLAAFPPDEPEALHLWMGTSLHAPGTGAIGAIQPGDVREIFRWPTDFAAGHAGESDFWSVSGTITLDEFEPYTPERWGVARGRLRVALEGGEAAGTPPVQRATVEVAFDVPVGFHVMLDCGPRPSAAMAERDDARRWPFLVAAPAGAPPVR